MKKIMACLLIASVALFAEQVEITAQKFSANETTLKSEFVGDVKVTKGKDVLKADKVVITFDKNRQPIKYIATGNASLNMKLKDKTYFAKGQELIYEPIKLVYTIKQDAYLHEKESDKKVYGETIIVNQKSGKYEVDGKASKPVKFIFQVDDKSVKK